MSAITLIATIFFSSMAVALAQPAVNAPLLPQYNYITGSGSDAVVSAVVVGDYAFTADTNGVWGANVQGSSNDVAPFWDALPGVTQLWSWCGNVSDASTCAVHAIAGPAVALYRINDTAIWRAAIFWATNATFDIISDSRSPSYMYPVVLPNAAGTSAFFVLGTRNTSNVPSDTYLPSTVYAFDVWDLSLTWSTVVNSDTTSFSTANCTDFVWILTQNQTFGYSDVAQAVPQQRHPPGLVVRLVDLQLEHKHWRCERPVHGPRQRRLRVAGVLQRQCYRALLQHPHDMLHDALHPCPDQLDVVRDLRHLRCDVRLRDRCAQALVLQWQQHPLRCDSRWERRLCAVRL